jgi:hypothetical protein
MAAALGYSGSCDAAWLVGQAAVQPEQELVLADRIRLSMSVLCRMAFCGLSHCIMPGRSSHCCCGDALDSEANE